MYILVLFQMVASLLCETRKCEDKTRERRPGYVNRHDEYMRILEPLAMALNIQVGELPANTPQPLLKLPAWVKRQPSIRCSIFSRKYSETTGSDLAPEGRADLFHPEMQKNTYLPVGASVGPWIAGML